MTLANSVNPIALIRSDSRGRLLVRAEQRAAILEAFDSSSLSGMAFCRQHGLSYSTFATWVQRRRKEAANQSSIPIPVPSSDLPCFTEVYLKEPTVSRATHRPLKITLPSGASFEISDPTQMPLIVELLRALSPAIPC